MRRMVLFLVFTRLLLLYSGPSYAQEAEPPTSSSQTILLDTTASEVAEEEQSTPVTGSISESKHQADDDPSTQQISESQSLSETAETRHVAATSRDDATQLPSASSDLQDSMETARPAEESQSSSRGDIEPTSVSDEAAAATPEPLLVPGVQVPQTHQQPDDAGPSDDQPASASDAADSQGAAKPETVPTQGEKETPREESSLTGETTPPETAGGESGAKADSTRETTGTKPEAVAVEDAGTPPPAGEDFPSFAEWRQKVLEEQEKIKLENQMAGTPAPLSPTKLKLRMNYASKNCGAKILATNPEAQNAKGVLTSNRDDYMINPCTAKKWFHVELCEPVQVKSVEVASLELFSSRPKAFRIYVSDRYPVKEWRLIGTYETTEERVTQTFQINDSTFVKYLRVEIPEHHGSEHYCPVTFFRVFGIEMADDDDDDNQEPQPDPASGKPDHDSAYVPVADLADSEDETESASSLFNSAKDTVVNLVKKVLYTEDSPGKEVEPASDNTTNLGKEEEAKENGSEADASTPCPEEVKSQSSEVPTVIIPSPTFDESKVSSTVTPLPTELPMVTKLEDNEQVPHIHTVDPMVTHIGLDHSSVAGDKVISCRNQSFAVVDGNCKHRMLCSYVNIMLGVTPDQSCDVTISESSLFDPGVSESIMDTPFLKSVDEQTPATDAKSAGNEDASTSVESAQQGGDSQSTPDASVDSSSQPEEVVESKATETEEVTVQPTMTDSAPVGTAPVDVGIVDHTSSQEAAPSSAMEEGKPIPTPTQTWLDETTASSSVGTATSDAKVGTDQGQTTVSEELPPLEPSEPVVAESPVNASPTPSLESKPASMSAGNAHTREVSETAETKSEKIHTEAPLSDPTGILTPPAVTPVVVPPPTSLSVVVDTSTKIQASGSTTEGREAVVSSSTEDRVIKASNVSTPPSRVKELVHIPPVATMKRETAISRLTNRIKALELNVSLSSRFLDELSQRFKKQYEDMMNKTLQRFHNATSMAERGDQKQQERLDILESRMDNLTAMVLQLASNVETMNQSLQDMNRFWTALQILLTGSLLFLCLWRRKADSLSPEIKHLLESMPRQSTALSNRRHSSEVVPRYVPTFSASLRQSSDTALDVLASRNADREAVNISIVEPEDVLLADAEVSKKRKKKKQKNADAKAIAGLEDNHLRHSSSPSSARLNTSAGLLFSVGGDEWEKQSHTKQSKLEASSKAPHKLSLGSLPSQSKPPGRAASTQHFQRDFQRGHRRCHSHGKEGRKGHFGSGPSLSQHSETSKFCLGRHSMPSEPRGRGASFVLMEKGPTISSTASKPPRPPPLPPRMNGVTSKKVLSGDALGNIFNGGSFGSLK